MKKINAIGLMSGTSLDGVDVAACTFSRANGKWSYSIRAARTYPYPGEWSEQLANLPHAGALEFCRTHARYGQFLGNLVNRFLKETAFPADLVASHGHTIFHQPEQGLTVQIGAGSAISAETGLPVVCDFRTADVALGGQGAPLVPIGDRLLFGEYGACLNLGGFANVSLENQGRRIAFDICPVNIVLNLLAGRLGFKYDENGATAASGKIDPLLLHKLDSLGY
jgi:anhydro-N-acetylmuramic acid kinase